MKKEVAILMVISLIVGFLIGYGYMSIRINKMEATIKELRGSLFEKATNRVLLNKCLDSAQELYEEWWDNECEGRGKEKDCRLPSDLAEHLNKIHQDRRDDCFKKYPQD